MDAKHIAILRTCTPSLSLKGHPVATNLSCSRVIGTTSVVALFLFSQGTVTVLLAFSQSAFARQTSTRQHYALCAGGFERT